MRAMILAAGKGTRLRPITNTIPKPLVKAHGYSLIAWHLKRLEDLHFTEVVVNGAYLKDVLFAYLEGIKANLKLKLYFSQEQDDGLETAGGIIKALPYFKDEPFLVVNGDIFYATSSYQELLTCPQEIKLGKRYAHLYVVNNPAHNINGDYAITKQGLLEYGHDFTFSGMAWYHPIAFKNCIVKREPLRPYFDAWVKDKMISASLLEHKWFDVGTKERLDELNTYIAQNIAYLKPEPKDIEQ